MERKPIQQEDDIESRLVDRIMSLFPSDIVKVILFGSRARGV